MARSCIPVLLLVAMCAFFAVAQSPSASPKASAAPPKAATPSQSQAPSPSSSTAPPPPSVVSSPPSPTPSSKSSPAPSIFPSSISSPPAEAPGPSENDTVSNGIAVAGSFAVDLVATVLIM